MNIAEKILMRLGDDELKVIDTLGQFAVDARSRLYLVGGVVRDLMMSGAAPDLDLAVDGDTKTVAKRAARALMAKSNFYGPFGTASLLLPSGLRVDLATARTETYSRPGALPKTFPSEMKLDLARRDFTINAMAASLMPDDFGELMDPYGGCADVEARKLRAIHDLSFRDDPTRILRGIRFAGRFDFSFDEHTEALVAESLSSKVLLNVSGSRLMKELRIALGEECRGKIVSLFRNYGIGASICEGFEFNPDLLFPDDLIRKSFDELSAEEGFKADPVVAALASVMAKCTLETEMNLSGLLDFSNVELDAVRHVSDLFSRMDMEFLSSPEITPSLVCTILEKHSDESLLCLHAMGNDAIKKRVRDNIRIHRKVRLEITGADLEKAGVPRTSARKQLLDYLLALKIDGVVRSKEEEMNAVEALTKKLNSN